MRSNYSRTRPSHNILDGMVYGVSKALIQHLGLLRARMIWLADGLCLPSDASSAAVHNPEALCDGFGLEQCEDARDDGHHGVPVLTRQPKDNDSVIILRRVVLNMREVQIKRDENALLGLTYLCDGRVGRAPQVLVENRVGVVTVRTE